MSEFDKILQSFDLQDTLNPKVWDSPEDPKDATLKPEIQKGLMKIAKEFIDYLGDDVFVDDIVLTGSLANFNWSSFSDFDLHVIVDLEKYGKEKDNYKEIFNLKKQLFNDKHDIKIRDYDVELYAQDKLEEHESTGVYSIMNKEWVETPNKQKNKINKAILKTKVQNWKEKINSLIEISEELSYKESKKKFEDLKEKLKEYRKGGLEKGGELSYENLVFKFLRRDGSVEKLFNALNRLTDKELSIEQQLTESIKEYLSEAPESAHVLGGGTIQIPADGAHSGQSGWQSNNAWDLKASIGDPVYALASGKLKTFSDYGSEVIAKDGKKLFGQSFTVDSDGDLPDIYYTHLQGSTLRKGDKVECGQLLGYVMDFPGSNYDHVHIGIESGHNIREFLNDDGTLKCAKGVKLGKYGKKFSEDNELPDVVSDSTFLKKLFDLASGNKNFEYSPKEIKYDSDVETIQTALQFLGFSLPKWGVDGKFGPETENAAKEFQKSVSITEDGKLSSFDLRYLVALMVMKKFKDEDLSKIQKKSEFELGNITDKNFYERLLQELGAPVSSENMKFLYAWRQAEGKGGKNNPFNTTWKLPGATVMNSHGVKNYETKEDGMLATLKTLNNGRYNCIVDGLKNDIGASEIAKCQSLYTWGTKDLIAKVIAGYEKGASPKISALS